MIGFKRRQIRTQTQIDGVSKKTCIGAFSHVSTHKLYQTEGLQINKQRCSQSDLPELCARFDVHVMNFGAGRWRAWWQG